MNRSMARWMIYMVMIVSLFACIGQRSSAGEQGLKKTFKDLADPGNENPNADRGKADKMGAIYGKNITPPSPYDFAPVGNGWALMFDDVSGVGGTSSGNPRLIKLRWPEGVVRGNAATFPMRATGNLITDMKGNGGQRGNAPTWKLALGADASGFIRTDMKEGDATELKYPKVSLIINGKTGANRANFYLRYHWQEALDREDGQWDHDYFLESNGVVSFTCKRKKDWLPGGCRLVVAYSVDIDGKTKFTEGAAADSIETVPVAKTEVDFGGGIKVSLLVNVGVKASAQTSLTKDFQIAVNKASPEHKSLSRRTKALVRMKGTFVEGPLNNWSVYRPLTVGSIKWENGGRVLAKHFQPK